MPPAPHIPIEQVIKATKSFAHGAGPLPDGLRADYLKQITGPDFVQLLVDGLVPSYLRPLLADHNFGSTGYNYSKLGWG